MVKKIAFASHNLGKVTELQAFVRDLPIEIIPQADFQLPSVEETGTTFVENALLKAKALAKKSGLATLADDSGLVVDSLKGQPGLYSSRYAGNNASDKDNIEKLLTDLDGVPFSRRKAYLYCVLVYLQYELDPAPKVFTGVWPVHIALAPCSEEGFGYDPVLYLESSQQMVSQLSPAQKNQLSHRGQALKAWYQTICEEVIKE